MTTVYLSKQQNHWRIQIVVSRHVVTVAPINPADIIEIFVQPFELNEYNKIDTFDEAVAFLRRSRPNLQTAQFAQMNEPKPGAGRPKQMKSGKCQNIYLDADGLEHAKRIGHKGNVSDGVRIALAWHRKMYLRDNVREEGDGK